MESIFDEAYSDLKKIWKTKVSKEIQENSFCEINRIIEDTGLFKDRRKATNGKTKNHPIIGPDKVEKISTFSEYTNQSSFLESRGLKRDTTYLYRARKYVRQIQHIFEVKKIGNRSLLKMITHLIDKNGNHEIETIDLTEWSGRGDQLVYWNADGNLTISDTLRMIYEIEVNYEVQCANGQCEDCCEYTLKRSKIIKLSTPVKILLLRKIPVVACPFTDTADTFTTMLLGKNTIPPTCLLKDKQKKIYSEIVLSLKKTQDSKKSSMKLPIKSLKKELGPAT